MDDAGLLSALLSFLRNLSHDRKGIRDIIFKLTCLSVKAERKFET